MCSSDLPELATLQRAKARLRRGRSVSTAAGEIVREEIQQITEGKSGARSTKQAIAIGVSKARRAGVRLRRPRRGTAKTRRAVARAYAAGQRRKRRAASRIRSRVISRALRRGLRRAASLRALASKAHSVAKRRGVAARLASRRRAARIRRIKGAVLRKAARKIAAVRKSAT